MFWDIQTGYVIPYPIEAKNKQKSNPNEIGLGLMNVAFSPDGQQFVAGGSDVSTMIGPTPQRWPALLCQKLVLNMTQERWREIVSSDIAYIPPCHDLPIPSDVPE